MSSTPPNPPAGNANVSAPLPPPRVPDHELIRRIGRGAYGEVWLARSATGAFRAVKIVHRQSFDHDRPFEREFEGILKFEPIPRRHDSQVDILHVGRGDDCFYYVMELADDQVTGGQINPDNYTPRTLKSDLMFQGRLPFKECVRIGLALTTALENLHGHGLVHRDVKPSNIIFVNGVPKLADIGLVTGLDATRSHVGTEGFAAPEGPGTAQADLYSLGKVLYEAATGKDRQEFPELPTQLRELPDREGLMELNSVIARACRHEPKDRYASATQMRADLEFLQSGQSITRKAARRRVLLLTAKSGFMVAGVVLLVQAAFLFRDWQTSGEAEKRLTTPALPDDLSRTNAIPDARELFATLDKALQSRADDCPRITPGRTSGDCTFAPVLLNSPTLRYGSDYFGCFRFTTPETVLDMAWAFVAPRMSLAWTLIPVGNRDDNDRGFSMFFSSPADEYREAAEAEGKTLYVQGLPGKWLQTNRDYLICFKFSSSVPVSVQVAMNFVPAGSCSETNLASLESVLGLHRGAAAVPFFREEIAQLRSQPAPDHLKIASSLHRVAMLFQQSGKLPEAEAALREALDELQKTAKQDSSREIPLSGEVLHHLADVLHSRRGSARARSFAESAVALYRRHPDWPTVERRHAIDVLRIVLRDMGDFAAAEVVCREQLQEARAAVPPDSGLLANALANLTLVLLARQEFSEAEPFARESLEIRQRNSPDDWRVFNARTMLGGSLLGQKKYAVAEPLLIAGYEGMKQREASIFAAAKPRLKEALQRLVQLYEETNRPEKAAEWKKKLSGFGQPGSE